MGKIKKMFKNEGETINLSTINDWFFNSSSADLGSDLSEITYFTCLKTLSEALGKMPIYLMTPDKERVLNHETAPFLQIQPNPVLTPQPLREHLRVC